MIWVNDTLELAYSAAQQVFGEDFTQEHVFAIYDRFYAEWRRLEDEDSEQGSLP